MDDHPRIKCTAKSRVTGGPCNSWAMHGGKVCRMHGGAAQKKAFRRKWAVSEAARAVATYGLAVETTPHEALQEELERTNGAVQFLEARLREMGEEEMLTRISTERKVGNVESYVTTKTEAAVAIHLELFLREREHLHKLARTGLQVGLAEKQLALSKRYVDAMDLVITNTLTALGVDVTAHKVRQIIAAEIVQADAALSAGGDGAGQVIPIRR